MLLYRHHAQAFHVTTMQLAFQITMKTNTTVVAFPATEEISAKQVWNTDQQHKMFSHF